MRSWFNPLRHAGGSVLCAALVMFCLAFAAGGQASAPLLLPGGLAYDAAGNLYFADTGTHILRKLTPGGVLSVVAGTGTQGFAGDGGLATAALLDAPGAVTVDGAGDVYFADTHNHRIRMVAAGSGFISTVVGTGGTGSGPDGVAATATAIDTPAALAIGAAGDLYFADARAQVVRRVDHATGLVKTVAGTGAQGFGGDGGQATAALLDSPGGLALDAAGNLYLSDGHNQRVRRVDAVTGIITTIAGGGAAGSGAGLRLPRGLTMDAGGNLYVVDAGNERIRRVDGITGSVTTVAGGAVEGFAGDGGQATLAALDTPRQVALSAAGQVTFTDSENARIRRVDGQGVVETIAGVGAVAPAAGLFLSGPASAVYGSGNVTVTLPGGGTGTATLLDGGAAVGSTSLAGGAGVFSLGGLAAGIHVLTVALASAPGQGTLLSNALTLAITAAPVVATPDAVTQVYGRAVPALTGTLAGVLAQDAGRVQVGFSSAASALSGAGSYPISAAITGPAAGNYALTTVAALVTIGKAGSVTTLSSGLLAGVVSATAGQPGGSVALLDGGTVNATLGLGNNGAAQFSQTTLSSGSHTLSASYGGDSNFLASASPPLVLTVGPSGSGDFSVASAGPAAVSVAAGSAASFSFLETPVNGGVSSQVVLSVAGLPAGATASFNPAFLVPGNASTPFTLTIQTIRTAGLALPGALFVAGLLGLFVAPRRQARWVLAGVMLGAVAGCGDRVNSAGQGGAQSRTYNITVNATATSSTGSTLLHSVAVTLTTE